MSWNYDILSQNWDRKLKLWLNLNCHTKSKLSDNCDSHIWGHNYEKSWNYDLVCQLRLFKSKLRWKLWGQNLKINQNYDLKI